MGEPADAATARRRQRGREAIAGGRLDTRLEAADDPDLGALVTSFNDMASALQDRIERDARFASDVSHELRSPLMTLSAAVEVLETRPRRAARPGGRRRSTSWSPKSPASASWSRTCSRSPASTPAPQRLELDEVRLAEFVLQAVGASSSPDVPVEVDAELAGAVVEADKRRLARVLANLLDNAQKYGGGATAVTLRRVDDRVQLAVEDAGPGVPDEDRARRSSTASPAAAAPAGAGAARASASASRSWPSTCASTAARCGSRTAPTPPVPASSSSCRSTSPKEPTSNETTPPSRVRVLLLALVAAVTVLAGGCGVPRDDGPREIGADRLPDDLIDDATATTQPDDVPGSRTALVYFVEGERLVAVLRDVVERTPAALLDTLFVPPSANDGADVTTAIPQGLDALQAVAQEDGVVFVELTEAINAIAGQTQKLAFAQMVFTLTELQGVSDVRFSLGEVELEVPTDSGSERGPVDRGDFVSLSPIALPPSTPTTDDGP